MKSFSWLEITPRSPLRMNWRFGGTCRFQIQSSRISQARNERDAGITQSRGDIFLQNSAWISTDHTALYVFQKKELFKCLPNVDMELPRRSTRDLCASVLTHVWQSQNCVFELVPGPNLKTDPTLSSRFPSLTSQLLPLFSYHVGYNGYPA
jgi:hypothetical protein